MKENDLHWLVTFVVLFSVSTNAFVAYSSSSINRPRARNGDVVLELQQTRTKSVYETADPSKLITLTDYLRNPKPAGKHESSGTLVGTNPTNTKDYRRLLLEAITSFKNSKSAQEIVDSLSSMGRSRTDQQQAMTDLLNDMLVHGPDQKLPLWSRWRFLSRYSKRARWATLRRTLDLTTPPPSVEDDVVDTTADQQRRRRRALVSLLRTLANPNDKELLPSRTLPVIVSIEKRAKMEQKIKPSADMRSRLPEGLETPHYKVVVEKAGYEIRRYDAFTVCSVSMTKPRPVDSYKTDATVSDPKTGGAKAFGALAGYLFGKNQESAAMKMTTPVINRGQDNDYAGRIMSFVLPSEYWKEGGLAKAPKPLEDSGVMLECVEGQERAVVMFGGYASKTVVDAQKQQLLEKLENDKDWIAADEAVDLFQYNDPFTPPWKRLNEVSVAVKPRL